MKTVLKIGVLAVVAIALSSFGFAQLVSPLPVPTPTTQGFATGNDFGPNVYSVNYYSNRNNGLGYDQFVRIVNTGATNSPLGDQEGYLCANLYIFDNTQEMLECCSCAMSANELLTLSVNTNLMNNALTGAPANDGVIKLVSTRPVSYTPGSSDSNGTTTGPTVRCNAENRFAAYNETANAVNGQLAAWATHMQIPLGTTAAPGAIGYTETAFTPALLSNVWIPGVVNGEFEFLPLACSFVHFLGSGKGRCTCPVVGGGLNH